MSELAPVQVGTGVAAASNSNTPSKNQSPITLLDDSTFKSIHNAFLLGWSLMELKSRIQITACNLALDYIAPNQQGSVAPNQQTPPFTAYYLESPPSDQPDLIDSILKNIVLNDVAVHRTQSWKDITKPITTKVHSLSTELQDNAWLTSMLRATFKQVITLHFGRYPDSDTTDTIYNLPPFPTDEDDLDDYPYPYLYPQLLGHLDYANVGISSIKKNNPGNTKLDAFVENFRIYEVARRALNCLTLLLTTPADSLEPATIKDYQKLLVPYFLVDSTVSTEAGGSYLNLAYSSWRARLDRRPESSTETNSDNIQDNEIKVAIKALSNLIIRLLEAWDSYLRESFYVDTNSSNDDPGAPDYEIELIAYEAGRSLAALSWGISVATVPLENTISPEQLDDSPYKDVLKEALTKKVRTTWMNVFNDRDVNHVQHQIAALSTALDEAYYRINKGIKPPAPDDPSVPPNPDLPGQAILAVKHSLDYWERAITRMCAETKPLAAPIPAKTQPRSTPENTPAQSSTDPTTQPQAAPIQGSNAAPAQQEITPTITSTNQQPAAGTPPPTTPLDWEKSKTLRAELIQQSAIWQSLILCQQGLRSFTVETVTQKILNDFMQNLEKAASQEIFNNGAFKWTLRIIAGIVAILLVIIGLEIYFTTQSNLKPLSIINSTPVIITAIVTTIGAIATPFLNGFLGKMSKIGSFFGSAGTTIEQALQNGYQQILVEFDYLNYNIGITFPLIEFFVWHEIRFDNNLIEDGYDFLVHVFWTEADRQEEIQRVTRAAFGPIGAFVGASLKLGDQPTGKRRET